MVELLGIQSLDLSIYYIKFKNFVRNTLHIDYINPSCHNFENFLPPRFVSQSCLGWPLAAWPAKGAP